LDGTGLQRAHTDVSIRIVQELGSWKSWKALMSSARKVETKERKGSFFKRELKSLAHLPVLPGRPKFWRVLPWESFTVPSEVRNLQDGCQTPGRADIPAPPDSPPVWGGWPAPSLALAFHDHFPTCHEASRRRKRGDFRPVEMVP